MSQRKRWSVRCLLAGIVIVGIAAASAAPGADKPEVSVREVPAQVVLYTLHRGPYETVGGTIGGLFGLAVQNGMFPQGAMTLVYLNNPGLVSPEHYLTEVRMPVGEAALQKAGTLGEFTDVKLLAGMEMAVVRKPKGVEDQTSLRIGLSAWMQENGHVAIDSCVEKMPSQGPVASYAEMETEIMYPIRKLPAEQD